MYSCFLDYFYLVSNNIYLYKYEVGALTNKYTRRWNGNQTLIWFPYLTLFDTTGAWLGNSILGVQKFAFHEFDPKILAFTDMKTFFSSKSVGFILHFSEILGFRGTHGTHANYAPDMHSENECFKLRNHCICTKIEASSFNLVCIC